VSEIATRPAQRRKRAAYRQQENEECNRRDVEPLLPGQFGPYCGRGGAAALMLGGRHRRVWLLEGSTPPAARDSA